MNIAEEVRKVARGVRESFATAILDTKRVNSQLLNYRSTAFCNERQRSPSPFDIKQAIDATTVCANRLLEEIETLSAYGSFSDEELQTMKQDLSLGNTNKMKVRFGLLRDHFEQCKLDLGDCQKQLSDLTSHVQMHTINRGLQSSNHYFYPIVRMSVAGLLFTASMIIFYYWIWDLLAYKPTRICTYMYTEPRKGMILICLRYLTATCGVYLLDKLCETIIPSNSHVHLISVIVSLTTTFCVTKGGEHLLRRCARICSRTTSSSFQLPIVFPQQRVTSLITKMGAACDELDEIEKCANLIATCQEISTYNASDTITALEELNQSMMALRAV